MGAVLLQAGRFIGRRTERHFEANRHNTADKTKYMIMSRDQNAGRSYSTKTDNSSIERAEEFKYLGTTLTNQNSIQEEIKSRLKLGNAESSLFQFAIQKFKDRDIKNYNFARCPVWVCNLVSDIEGGT